MDISYLKNERIFLRPFVPEDAEEHLSGEDYEQIKWLSGGKSNLKDVKEWIDKSIKYWKDEGPVFVFAIVNKENKRIIGMVEANTDNENLEGVEQGDANISYGLYPKDRGKGYAVDAVMLLILFLKQKEIKRAIIRVNPSNAASVKIPSKLAFVNIGNNITKNGENLDIYSKDL